MEEKVCGNCKNYIVHYVRHKACLLETGGHCAKQKPRMGLLRFYNKLQKGCEKWESVREEKNKKNECIFQTIREIKKQLNDIALILKVENNPNTPN